MEFIEVKTTRNKQELKFYRFHASAVGSGSCSACSATCMQFIKKQGRLIPSDFRIKLCAGRDLSEEDMEGENVFLIGNCAAAHADGRPFCKGCPPIGSAILAFVRGEEV